MLRLVTIDLTDAKLDTFEAYEAKVLAMMERHGAKMETRVRSLDGARETHIVFYPSQDAYIAFLADPDRQAARSDWERCGARSESIEVARVN